MVSFGLRLRSREMAHQESGMNLLERVQDDTAEVAKIEAYPRLEDRQMLMVLSPKWARAAANNYIKGRVAGRALLHIGKA